MLSPHRESHPVTNLKGQPCTDFSERCKTYRLLKPHNQTSAPLLPVPPSGAYSVTPEFKDILHGHQHNYYLESQEPP